MYKITDNLATHGLGEPLRCGKEETYEWWVNTLDKTDWHIIDVRILRDDDTNSLQDYIDSIGLAEYVLQEYGYKIVICCASGQSRSNAIAIGVLMKTYRMDFYEAYNLVDEKVPICNIEPSHIYALKKIFHVGPP